jgi:mRNA interferase MazF
VTVPEVEPWQVWWVDFDPQVGREQAGLRPGVIVGSNFACRLPNELVILVPCTTTDRGLPFHPQVTSIVKRPTFAMCDQPRSVSRPRLRRLSPTVLSAEDREAIAFGLRRMFAAA